MIIIKNDKQIELMQAAADALKKALEAIEKEIKPGITTLRLNQVAEEAIKKAGARPAFKGVPCPYKGGKPYKHAICVSVNDEIIHGVPSNRILQEGDLVSVDLGTIKNGWCSDAGRSYGVGNISKVASKLIATAESAFFDGINQAVVGNRIGDISNAIETHVKRQGFTLLREFQGHGIGQEMHEDPGVPNIGKKNTGARLQKGMALAIEPMICEGKPDVYVKDDLWTIATDDGKLTSYYENTIVITDNEPRILTL